MNQSRQTKGLFRILGSSDDVHFYVPNSRDVPCPPLLNKYTPSLSPSPEIVNIHLKPKKLVTIQVAVILARDWLESRTMDGPCLTAKIAIHGRWIPASMPE